MENAHVPGKSFRFHACYGETVFVNKINNEFKMLKYNEIEWQIATMNVCMCV